MSEQPFDKAAFAQECDRRRKAGLTVKGDTYDRREAWKAWRGPAGERIIWDSRQEGWLFPDEGAIHALTEGMAVRKMGSKYWEALDPDRKAKRYHEPASPICANCGSPGGSRRAADVTGRAGPVCKVCSELPQELRDYS